MILPLDSFTEKDRRLKVIWKQKEVVSLWLYETKKV
jgi:hypothetical protein